MDRIEILTRKAQCYDIIIALYGKIASCDETDVECDVCVGLHYAISTIEHIISENIKE